MKEERMVAIIWGGYAILIFLLMWAGMNLTELETILMGLFGLGCGAIGVLIDRGKL